MYRVSNEVWRLCFNRFERFTDDAFVHSSREKPRAKGRRCFRPLLQPLLDEECGESAVVQVTEGFEPVEGVLSGLAGVASHLELSGQFSSRVFPASQESNRVVVGVGAIAPCFQLHQLRRLDLTSL